MRHIGISALRYVLSFFVFAFLLCLIIFAGLVHVVLKIVEILVRAVLYLVQELRESIDNECEDLIQVASDLDV